MLAILLRFFLQNRDKNAANHKRHTEQMDEGELLLENDP